MHSWEYGFGSEETPGLKDVGEFTNGVFSQWSVLPATKLLVLPSLSLGC